MKGRRTTGLGWLGIAVLVAASATTGCSRGGEGDDGNGTPPVQSGDLMAIVRGAEQRLAELDGQPREAIEREMNEWLSATNAFEEVGIEPEGSVWARFPSGELFIVVTNRPGIPPEEQRAEEAGRSQQELRAALPANVGVFSATTLAAPDFAPPAMEILGWATGNGYVESGHEASVDALMNVQDTTGLFYIDSHGGSGRQRDRTKVYSIWTSTRVTEQTVELYDRQSRSGELTFMLASSGTGADETRFGFTAKFVTAHMRLSHDSVVFINACSSDDDSMKRAFLSPEVGAGLYAGWVDTVHEPDAVRVGRLVLDRLLGRNVAYVTPGNPERRPFTIDGIAEELNALGWNPVTTHSPSSPGVYDREVAFLGPVSGEPRVLNALIFSRADTTVSPGLAPSLMAVRIDEIAHTLTATGELGMGVDRITFAGHSLPIVSTSTRGALDEVVADLSGADVPFSGPVVVESRGRRSNAKTVVGWTMHVQWSRTLTTMIGTVVHSADCSLSFRAAVRGARAIAPNERLVPIAVDRVELADRSSCRLSSMGEETWMTGSTTHVATYSAARMDPIYAPELATRANTYLVLGLDGGWSLHAGVQERDVVLRTSDGAATLELMSTSIVVGSDDVGRFDPELFNLPPGSHVVHGDTEIRWETVLATPTPEHGEGFAYPG